MKESFWEKDLLDGSKELGTDSMIDRKAASWTRGRQDIVSVTLFFANTKVTLQSPPVNGEVAKWEQYDGCIFNSSTGKSSVIAREIRCSSHHHSCVLGMRRGRNEITYTLDDKVGSNLPEDSNTFICRIESDGRVELGGL